MLGAGMLSWNQDGVALNKEQKQFYEKNGYIVIRNCVPKFELDRYFRRFKEVCEGQNVLPEMTVMKDITLAKSEFKNAERAVNKLLDFNSDPVLFSYCAYPTVVNVVKDLIGKPETTLMSMNTMLINKPPDTGKLTSRHPMHQDLHYFPFRPADFICCAWTAMERINRANGCLVVVPGTHKGELLVHEYPQWEGGVNKAYHGIQNYAPSMPRLHVEMEAGDTVFFHPLLIHGSGANRTDGYRKAISCHYANDDLCRYVDVTNTSQEAIAKEAMGMMRKKFANMGVRDKVNTYEDLWRVRARVVNGTRSNL